MQWGNPMQRSPVQSRAHALRAALQSGFSLIEILIVVALIAVIAGMVANQVFGGQDKAKWNLTRTQIQTLAGKIEQYQLDNGGVPSSLEDLVRQPSGANSWLGPYAKEADLKDQWGKPLNYSQEGEAGYTIGSYGKDGKAGGESWNRDISSAD